MEIDFEELLNEQRARPRHYHRDGTPIVDNELMPAWQQWALLFETENRIVAHTTTLYGEKLSTVWLGLDHSFFGGRPLLFETMLFCPDKWNSLRPSTEELQHSLEWMRSGQEPAKTEAQKQRDEENAKRQAHREKYFPHDQLQLRYTTENEAADSHETLKMQCLIPPRWRHFLLWTIGRQEAWRNFDDESEDE